jgi:probable rRNA maturation factor
MPPLISSLISFYTESTNYTLKDKNKIRSWIASAIKKEKKKLGPVNFIICSDKYLLKLNNEYLEHDYYTDIITFDNSDIKNTISGDIFISIDRVRDNAKTFSKSLKNELHRVIIHGILHLIGYNDKSPQQKKIMTSKEDYYLSLLH